jgi:TIR domain
MDNKLFISYTENDSEIISGLLKKLNSNKIKISLDNEEADIYENWGRRHRIDLEKSTVFIPLISRNYLNSRKSLQEIGAAIGAEKRILPFQIEPLHIPAFIVKYSILDCSKLSILKLQDLLVEAICNELSIENVDKLPGVSSNTGNFTPTPTPMSISRRYK